LKPSATVLHRLRLVRSAIVIA